jgi:hypothetical protein
MKIDMAFFPSVEGSMTSEDGHTFMLHVKRPTGSDLMLGLGRLGISGALPDHFSGVVGQSCVFHRGVHLAKHFTCSIHSCKVLNRFDGPFA